MDQVIEKLGESVEIKEDEQVIELSSAMLGQIGGGTIAPIL
jgi:hypothetical protein